jgi:hypothetical protein
MKRLWTVDQMKSEAGHAGFHHESTSMTLREKIPAHLVLNEARNRETSELLLIDYEHYKDGMKRLEAEITPHNDKLIDWGLMITELHFTKQNPNK